MRVLIVGGGGREHALAWKIAQSPLVEAVFAAPGNPGIARHATCIDLGVDAHDGLVAFAQRERIDLTVVGPEIPLVGGLADKLADAGLTVFGPSARAAAIEGSKVFSKSLMSSAGVPTAWRRQPSSCWLYTSSVPSSSRTVCTNALSSPWSTSGSSTLTSTTSTAAIPTPTAARRISSR